MTDVPEVADSIRSCASAPATVDKAKITGLAAITKQNIDDPKVAPFVYKSC
jgi:hypothetical protein